MINDRQSTVGQSPSDLEAIATLVKDSAEKRQGDGLALLSLLRLLEELHQSIQNGLFQECLPDNRQALYAMLRDMEAEGGWPYIPRMKLSSFIKQAFPEILEGGPASEHENPLNR